MRQRVILLFLLLLAAVAMQAQDLTVRSFGVAAGDLDARSSETRRTDRNGTPCALVKVQLPLQGAQFDGVVGDVQFRAGTYWVYLPNGAYLMNISHPQYHRLDLNLRTLWKGEERFYGVEQLTTYNLIINVPQTGPVETRTQKLVINYTPANAMVLIDSKLCGENGRAESDLPLGEHSYMIAAKGYITAEGTVKLNGGKQRILPVELDKDDATAAQTATIASPIPSAPIQTQQQTAQINEQVHQTDTVQHAVLGIQGCDVELFVDEQKKRGNKVNLGTMEGVYILHVIDGCAAQEAGLEEGDVIIGFDGQFMNTFGDLSGIIAQRRPGDKVMLTYLHKKKKISKIVTLGSEQRSTRIVYNTDLDLLGADFREINDQQMQQLGIDYGVEVIKLNPGKLKDAGVTKGFIIRQVNKQPVKTVSELQNLVKEVSTSSEPVLIIKGVYPTGKNGYFVVQLNE